MIYEIAITPSVFGIPSLLVGGRSVFVLLEELFYPTRSPENVFLAKLTVESWLRRVLCEIRRLPPQEQTEAMKLLNKLEVYFATGSIQW